MEPSDRGDARLSVSFAEGEVQLGSAPATEVHVQVIDLDGNPIAGASVRASWGSETRLCESDEEGMCAVAGLRAGTPVFLTVTRKGLTAHRQFLQAARELLVVVLLELGSVRWVVVDKESGTPLPGAIVIFDWERAEEASSVTLDGRGCFEDREVPQGVQLEWNVRCEGYLAEKRTFVALPGDSEVRFELHPALPAEFRVFDAHTGQGIPDAILWTDALEVTTDKEGRARSSEFIGKHELVLTLRAGAEGHCSVRALISAEVVRSGRLISLPLVHSSSLTFDVLGRSGNPVESDTVRVTFDGPMDSPTTSMTSFNDGSAMSLTLSPFIRTLPSEVPGRWHLEGLPPETPCVVHVEADGFVQKLVPDLRTPPPGAHATIAVTLDVEPPMGTIQGRIRVNGRARRTTVEFSGPTETHAYAVDEDGRFSIPVPAGVQFAVAPNFWIFQDKSTCRSRYVEPVQVTVSPGERRNLDFDLEVELGSISGRFLASDGTPVEGVQVAAHSSASCWPDITRTDELGAFMFEVGMDVSTFDVEAFDGIWRLAEENVPLGTNDLLFQQVELRPIVLSVLDQDSGLPLRGGELWLEDDRGKEVWFPGGSEPLEDSQSRLRFELPPGDYTARVSDDMRLETNHLPSDDFAFSVVLGSEPLELRVRRKLGLELRTHLAGNVQPWEFGAPKVVLAPTELFDFIESSESGLIHVRGEPIGMKTQPIRHLHPILRPIIHGLEPGSYRFKVFPPTIRILPEVIEVEGPGPQTVELRWEPVE